MATKQQYVDMADACYNYHSNAIYYDKWIAYYNINYYTKSRWKNKYPELYPIYKDVLFYQARVFLILLAGELCENN